MIKLTEEMVIARTRISDLQSVKKLNCWGSDINDVSLLRKMPNVEVLALSVNQIKTLEDFQFCEKLEELYIRKNDIKNLSDVFYLKGLSRLRNLWLADNPCSTFKTPSEAEIYRMTVIRALPQLEKLDDILVTISEKQDAMKLGLDVSITIKEEKEDDYNSQSESIKLSSNALSSAPVDSNSESKLPNFDWHTQTAPKSKKSVSPSLEMIETTTKLEVDINPIFNQSPNKEVPIRRFSTMICNNSSQIQTDEIIHSSESAPVSRRSSLASVSTFSPIAETNFTPYSATVSPNTATNEQTLLTRCPIHNSSSSEAIGTREASVTETSPNSNSSSNLNRKASTVTSHSDIYDAIPHNDARNYYTESRPARLVQDILPPRVSSHGFANQSPHQTPISASGQNNERFSPTRSRNRTRASNLLMATLCLVNELDFASLEVLAMAIRNRMDDLQVDE